MKIISIHKYFDTLLLILLVFSGGILLFNFYSNEFSLTLLLMALFIIGFMGKQIKRSIFNTSLFILCAFSFLILLNYIIAPGRRRFLKYGFRMMQISTINNPLFLVEMNEKLIEYYRNDISNLSKLLNRELNHWIN